MDTERATALADAGADANPVMKAFRDSKMTLLGLADASGTPRTTLRRLLINPGLLAVGQLRVLAVAMGVDPEKLSADVLAYLEKEVK